MLTPLTRATARWLTYGQLAEARQIGRRAAVRLAQRHRLRRQPGNDGTVRVWVPADMAASSPFRPHPPATPDAADADEPRELTQSPFTPKPWPRWRTPARRLTHGLTQR